MNIKLEIILRPARRGGWLAVVRSSASGSVRVHVLTLRNASGRDEAAWAALASAEELLRNVEE